MASLILEGRLAPDRAGRFGFNGSWFIETPEKGEGVRRSFSQRFFTPWPAERCPTLANENSVLEADYVTEEPEVLSASPSSSTSLVTPNSVSGSEPSSKKRKGSFGEGGGLAFSPAVSVDDESSHHSRDVDSAENDSGSGPANNTKGNESTALVSSTETSPSSSPLREPPSEQRLPHKPDTASISRKVSVAEETRGLSTAGLDSLSNSSTPVTPAGGATPTLRAGGARLPPPKPPGLSATVTVGESSTANLASAPPFSLPLSTPSNPSIPPVPVEESYARGPYVDAGVKYPGLCPIGGTWKGSFENSPKKSGKVFERFVLYLNAAKEFENPEGGDKPRCIHVVGSGSNKFGVFALSGQFNPHTKVLRLARSYMTAGTKLKPVTAAALNLASSFTAKRPRAVGAPSRRHSSKDALPGTVDMGSGENGNMKTRKKLLSWQRPDGAEPNFDDLEDASPVAAAAAAPRKPRDPNPKASKKARVKGGRGKDRGSGAAAAAVAPLAPPKVKAPVRPSFPLPKLPTKKKHPLPPPPNPALCKWRSAFFFGDDKKEVYEGDLLNSQRHGQGVFLYRNGHTYEGSWRKNMEHGKGTIYDKKRQIVYAGEFEKGKLNGTGTYYFSDGGCYIGEWRENLRSGQGEYRFPNKCSYVGDWREDKFWGKGRYTWNEGRCFYDGDWQNNLRHGKGVIKLEDGFHYDGQWHYDAMEGRATAVYPNGQRYEGVFSKSLRDGRGTIIFPNGAVYEGRFKEDKIEGQGTFSLPRVVRVDSAKGGGICEAQAPPKAPEPRAGGGVLGIVGGGGKEGKKKEVEADAGEQFLIPVTIADMEHIHVKSGFTAQGC